MSFIRPEVALLLTRWRESLAGGAAALGGLWLMLSGSGSGPIIGLGLFVGGGLIAINGIRRARFRTGSGGPGFVEIDERQITYFGPEGGGAVSLDALAAVSIRRRDRDAQWVFQYDDGSELEIPTTAQGADQLYDAISALPGVHYDALAQAVRGRRSGTHPIWQVDRPRLH